MIYNYSFAELCDRLGIVVLKQINSKEKNLALDAEINEILHDIDLHIKQTPINAEMIKGITVLAYVNKFIFDGETDVREKMDENNPELLPKLIATHKANSLRAASKKHIQNQRNERIDPKLNYGNETGLWNITF